MSIYEFLETLYKFALSFALFSSFNKNLWLYVVSFIKRQINLSGNNHYEKISTRNRSIDAKKYNIGISRLALADVQEITEYEDSTDDSFTPTNQSKVQKESLAFF